jgi:hypothetical protein
VAPPALLAISSSSVPSYPLTAIRQKMAESTLTEYLTYELSS